MILGMLGILVVFPLVVALAVWVVRNVRFRAVVTYAASIVIIAVSIALAVRFLAGEPVYLEFDSQAVDRIAFTVDLAVCIVVIVQGIRCKHPLAIVLAFVQGALAFFIEFGGIAHSVHVEHGLYVDSLSAIMTLMIGVIGGLICIYAVGYMRDFEHHHEGDVERQHLFFGLMFIFLSSMYVVVFSNNLLWLLAGWEATTLCSFLLIGYTCTEEAIENSFRQIKMNLLGGIAFSIGIIWMVQTQKILALDGLVAAASSGGTASAILMAPIALLAFAGLVKAAQMPFQSWLLGAMVAPTPTSALLHSSTMVKAGVFLLVKLSPCLGMTFPGIMVATVGGLTFLFTAMMAVSQTNAKRVLAYSTISNLGLIALCAGIGTQEGVWAAIFLMAFHAIFKATLFMCVGTVEHHVGSRDIELMDNLFNRMPQLSRIMGVGMLCMFAAPFGMLVAKWTTMVSVVNAGNLVSLVLIAFGSGPTFFFWTKWLGKISAVGPASEPVEGAVHRSEWIAVGGCLTIGLVSCAILPVISNVVVSPYAAAMFGLPQVWEGDVYLIFCSALVFVLAIGYLLMFGRSGKRRQTVYLAGVGVDPDHRVYAGSMGATRTAASANWTISEWFSEKVLDRPGSILCAVLMCAGIVLAALSGGGAVPWIL